MVGTPLFLSGLALCHLFFFITILVTFHLTARGEPSILSPHAAASVGLCPKGLSLLDVILGVSQYIIYLAKHKIILEIIMLQLR